MGFEISPRNENDLPARRTDGNVPARRREETAPTKRSGGARPIACSRASEPPPGAVVEYVKVRSRYECVPAREESAPKPPARPLPRPAPRPEPSPESPSPAPQSSPPPAGASAKSLRTFVALAVCIGWAGAHNFYAGRVAVGACQLAATLAGGFFETPVPIAAAWLWALGDAAFVRRDGGGKAMK